MIDDHTLLLGHFSTYLHLILTLTIGIMVNELFQVVSEITVGEFHGQECRSDLRIQGLLLTNLLIISCTLVISVGWEFGCLMW